MLVHAIKMVYIEAIKSFFEKLNNYFLENIAIGIDNIRPVSSADITWPSSGGTIR